MPKRILVIDDELGVRKAFELSLGRHGYMVETASGGEEGIAKAQARKPDLIFLDLRMPGIDGLETLRRLQNCCATVPVYIVTAFQKEFFGGLQQAAADGLRFQVADKPLDDKQIGLIARGVLEGATV